MDDYQEDPNLEVTQEDNPDGTTTVTVTEIDEEEGAAEVEVISVPFDANLAEFLEDDTLKKLGRCVQDWAEDDGESRDEWEKDFSRGMNLLGLKYEERTDPWEGACGAYHPMLTESTIRFQADFMAEIVPPSGPARTKIIGRGTKAKEKQARRIREDLNYQFMNRIPGYVEQTEKLAMNIPIAGASYRKFWYDKFRKRICSDYIPAERIRIPYSADSLESSPRFIIDMYIDENELERQQKVGHYLEDVKLHEGVEMTQNEVETTKDEIQGEAPTVKTGKDEYLFYECYGLYCIKEIGDEIAAPYVITVDSETGCVLSVYRNYEQGDDTFEELQWVVPWNYLPPIKGPHGLGLVNILGNLADSSTQILRQLVDAGTLANMPAGFRDKSLRIKGDNTPFTPGEWRSVDAAGGSIREGFMPLPYKEPSGTLYQLMNTLIEEGRRLGATADMKVADMGSQQMPVGTILAILERTMKVMSGVMRRMHTSMGKEIRIVERIVKTFMSELPYPFELDEEDQGATRQQDYDARVDVVPVSNPNAATQGQRIMKAQAIHQLALSDRQSFDMHEVNNRMLTALDVDDPDKVLPSDEEVKPLDPLTENMNLIVGKPVRASMGQNHEAHITAHMAAIENPRIGELLGQSQAAPQILAAAQAHIQEHIAFQMRMEVEQALGYPLPPPGEPLPEDVEVMLSQMIAAAMEKVTQKDRAEQQQEEVLDKLEDPVVQNQRMEAETKRMQVENKAAEGQRRLDIEERKQSDDQAIKRAQLLKDLYIASQEAAARKEESTTQQAVEGAKAGIALVEKNVSPQKDSGRTGRTD
jgi:chaperonin GroES